MENRVETRMKLDQVLELERALARQRRREQRQQQWQWFLRQGKRLQAILAQAWLMRNQGFAKILISR